MSQEIPKGPYSMAIREAGSNNSVVVGSEISKESDSESLVYDVELQMLRNVFAKSSDLLKGRRWEGFRNMCGGITKLESDHAEAVRELEQWYADRDYPDDY